MKLYKVENNVRPFVGKGNRALNDIIGNNYELFKDCLAYRDELGRIDETGSLIRCRKLAIETFVLVEDISNLISKCLHNVQTPADFENIFFQSVALFIADEIANYIKENEENLGLAEEIHKKLISNEGSKVTHFLISL